MAFVTAKAGAKSDIGKRQRFRRNRESQSFLLSAGRPIITQLRHSAGDFRDIDDWLPDILAGSLNVIDGRLHRRPTTADDAEIVEKRIAAEHGLPALPGSISEPIVAVAGGSVVISVVL